MGDFKDIVLREIDHQVQEMHKETLNRTDTSYITELQELRRENCYLKMKNSIYNTIKLYEKPDDEVKVDLEEKTNTETSLVGTCENHSWSHLLDHLLELTCSDHKMAVDTLKQALIAQYVPGFDPAKFVSPLEDERQSLFNWLYFPYLKYFQQIKENMKEESKNIAEIKNNCKRSATDHIILFYPSLWFSDFIQVYKQAQTVNFASFPNYYNMENICYSQNIYRLVNSRDVQIEKNFALDMVIQIPRFASSFTILHYSSEKYTDVFTDFQILLFYAMRRSSKVSYKHFLDYPWMYLQIDLEEFKDNPQKYFVNHLNETRIRDTLTAVAEAVRHLLSSRDPNVRFGIDNKNRLCLNKLLIDASGTESLTRVGIPQEVMSDLKNDILPNIMLYETDYSLENTSTDEGMTGLTESPLSKYLNFHSASRNEFVNFFKRTNGTDATTVNAKKQDEVRYFSCVAEIYALLMSAALTVVNMSEMGTFSDISCAETLSRCVQVFSDGNKEYKVKYSSTCETFPGMLFFSFLGVDDERLSTQKMFTSTFFKRKYRKSFFDCFAKYCSQLPQLSDSKNVNYLPKQITKDNWKTGIRFVTMDSIRQFRNANFKNVNTVVASFLNILSETVSIVMNQRLHMKCKDKEKDIMQYFYEVDIKGGKRGASGTESNGRHAKNFYILPLHFTYGHFIVKKEEREPSTFMTLFSKFISKITEEEEKINNETYNQNFQDFFRKTEMSPTRIEETDI